MKLSLFIIIITICSINHKPYAQTIPDQYVLEVEELTKYLKSKTYSKLEADGAIANDKIASYFREKFSKSFFYDYRNVDERMAKYNELYDNQDAHKSRAIDHLNKYTDSTQWVLPFDYKNGEAVNAYALRHLARQHKMVDIAFHYFNENKDPQYIRYFETQMRSLNAALKSGEYEKIEDGNGVYEVYRSGYRIFNWIWIHNMFLNEKEYSDRDQLSTIATLLQHGQHLYERNDHFRSGNHQTKGVSALAVLSILLSDFVGTELWYERAMSRLGEHLDREINPDGFQFERSIHYHMSDINNYFYIYQLAKINGITVDKSWKQKLRSLFTTLVKVAYPDKSAPVLQDDTEIPWAEKNDISGAMTLGYLLFDDPEFGYFASDKVDDRMYWYLSDAQVVQLANIEQKQPSYGSLAFEDTGYYISRDGWNMDDKMMIISAGLDDEKPDHQHGDILGIQAIAYGQSILPNYQVRYSLKDFDFFKNSMVKNVALVDNELQGKRWTANKGGSGFGKFKKLPTPEVKVWNHNDDFDLFVGSHDGFENIGVNYSRQVIYVKDAFWLVKDNFRSEKSHDYKQVWQGHFTQELAPNLIRAVFPDATGCDILQLNPIDTTIVSGTRGKNWTIASKKNQTNFEFLTVIFPYKGYNNRIDESRSQVSMSDWIVNDAKWAIEGSQPTAISKEGEVYFFGVRKVQLKDLIIEITSESDLFVKLKGEQLFVHLLGDEERTVTMIQDVMNNNDRITKVLKPREDYHFELGTR